MKNESIQRTFDLSVCSEPERQLYYSVISPTLAVNCEKYLFPQYVFHEEGGQKRKIDFAVVTENTKIAIELDGYKYHSEGQVSSEKFSDDLRRQNELVLAGWKVIRFSWNQVRQMPESCRDHLRKAIIADPDLHPYLRVQDVKPHAIQEEALKRLDASRKAGAKKGLVVMATGLGKTILSALDSKSFGGRVLFIVHNNSILEQARDAFLRVSPEKSRGLFNSNEKMIRKDIVFANISSLRNPQHLSKFKPDEFDYVVIDEVHHSATKNWSGVINYFKPKFLLGMTATPNRTDNQPILPLFDNNLIYEITQSEAISRGFLVPFHYFALKDNVDYTNIRHNGYRYYLEDLNKALLVSGRDESIISKYRLMTNEGKAIAFCVSIDHAERSAEHFNSAGIKSIAIHSRIDDDERRKRIEDFRNNIYKVVFVRDIFNEGIDFPDIDTLIFMRPTESKIIFTQQLGRGLRLNALKKSVQVLDFIGNYINADKIIDYLSALGGQFNMRDLKKPMYEYDNGCQISFEQSALDTITVLKANVVSDNNLIDNFFMLITKYGRCPSIAEIQSDTVYRVKHYVERYGKWEAFIDRIRTLDPNIDVRPLELPASLKNYEIDQYANLLDLNEQDFINTLKDVSTLIQKAQITFVSLGGKFNDDDHEKIFKILKEFDAIAQAIHGDLKEVMIILGFRYELPKTVPTIENQSSTNELGSSIAKNMFLVTTNREAGSFSRMFCAKLPLLARLVSLVKDYTSSSSRSEIGILADIYATSLHVDKSLLSFLELFKQIKLSYQNEWDE